MTALAREAWDRTRNFLDTGKPAVHRLLVLAWSPLVALVFGWAWLRGLVESDRPIWTAGGTPLVEIAVWLLVVLVLAYAGAKAELGLARELAGTEELHARPYFLYSCLWAALLLGLGLVVTRGCFPGWPVVVGELLLGLGIGAVSNESLMVGGVWALARRLRQDPSRGLLYLGWRLGLGILAVLASSLYLAIPVLILAAVWLNLALLTLTILMAQVPNWPACVGALVGLLAFGGLEALFLRHGRSRTQAALKALVGCFWTAASGYRKVLWSLLACLGVALLIQSIGFDPAGIYVFIDGYLDFLLVFFVGRLVLAAFTPAILFLRFFSWLCWRADSA